MSKVTGTAEVTDALGNLIVGLGGMGKTIGDVAVSRARKLAPTLATLETPVLRPDGAVLSFSGVIYPAGFGAAVSADLETAAVDAVTAKVDAAIQKAGLA